MAITTVEGDWAAFAFQYVIIKCNVIPIFTPVLPVSFKRDICYFGGDRGFPFLVLFSGSAKAGIQIRLTYPDVKDEIALTQKMRSRLEFNISILSKDAMWQIAKENSKEHTGFGAWLLIRQRPPERK